MKYIFITFLCFLIISCGNKSANSQERFSRKLDTSYKVNSTEVESITRTFYKKGDVLDDHIYLQQTVGKKDYVMNIYEKKANKVQVVLISEEKMPKLFEDMNTVISNSEKNLNFTFGQLDDGIISALGKDEISIFTNGVSHFLNKAEIDSMKSCYLKYKTEIK